MSRRPESVPTPRAGRPAPKQETGGGQRSAGQGEQQVSCVADRPWSEWYEDAGGPRSCREHPLVICDPWSAGRIDHLNHGTRGPDRAENSKMAALGVLEENDCGTVKRFVALAEPNPLEAKAKRTRRCRQLQHRISLGRPGRQHRLEIVVGNGHFLKVEQDEERVGPAVEFRRLLGPRSFGVNSARKHENDDDAREPRGENRPPLPLPCTHEPSSKDGDTAPFHPHSAHRARR